MNVSRSSFAGPGESSAVRRVGDLKQATVFRKALFVPPGYSSLLFAHLHEANSCPMSTSLFRGFKSWVHKRLAFRHSPSSGQTQVSTFLLSSGIQHFVIHGLAFCAMSQHNETRRRML